MPRTFAISDGSSRVAMKGLSIVRTSPDHGTAYDIAGKNKADETSLRQAIFDYLRQSDRVLLTPHVAGWTQESYVKINEEIGRAHV